MYDEGYPDSRDTFEELTEELAHAGVRDVRDTLELPVLRHRVCHKTAWRSASNW